MAHWRHGECVRKSGWGSFFLFVAGQADKPFEDFVLVLRAQFSPIVRPLPALQANVLDGDSLKGEKKSYSENFYLRERHGVMLNAVHHARNAPRRNSSYWTLRATLVVCVVVPLTAVTVTV